MKEREIDLIDLLVEILLHWQVFVILMVAGIVLFGGFSYIRFDNDIRSNQLQAETIITHPESVFSQEEMQNATYVAAYETVYNAKNTYLKESPLMNIDPNHVNKAEATVTIIAEDHQKSCDIEKVYEDIVQSGELCTEVAKEIGIETASVNEIIFLPSRNNDENTIQDTNTFRVVAIYTDDIQCQNILELVIAFLEKKQPDIENILGKHEIAVVNKSFGIVSDSDIATAQKTVLNDIATMKSVISTAKDNLSDTELQYYFSLMGTSKNNSPRISIKHVFLEAIIIPFLYMLILFVIYILNTKIRITDNLQELYDIPQLGMIPIKKKPKKFFGFIDEWILSLRNRSKRHFSSEEALDLATVAIKISAGKEKLQEICLVGCGLKERSHDLCEEIKTRLLKDNIQINILNNILYDAQMMDELEDAKGVVLIESAGSTLYSEILDELNLLKRQGIKVLGGILVE